MVEKYYNEDKCMAVLISKDFGAGWSTWNVPELAYDKRIIEKWLTKPTAEEMRDFLNEIDYDNIYMDGYYDLDLVWVEPNHSFKIKEYDGRESIEYFSPELWINS